MNILVVEDNEYEINNIARVLQSISKEFRIYKALTGEECFKVIEKADIDLFILDIELPDISGVKIAEKIRNISKYELTYIIFITTHIYLQLEAFKTIHCYDFLEKPYKKEELIKIIMRLSRGISSEKQQNKLDRQQVSFQMKDFIIKVYIDEILFVEAQKRNCIIHTKEKVYTIKSMAIKKVIEILPKECFMRTHRSYIVNLKNIHKIEKSEKNSWIIYFEGYFLPVYVSNSCKKEFLELFCG
ncbi:LytR/AlgR family response regulator transcription factor [Alkaliphilus metalliredigens]|uniref:LytR/AlgR family response regulator transcription factor n=1 Tax=Alkaliphilus metalliredigens TaxID=208226 RepID=UPI0005A1808F|nr:LytTR family DNA-binding domain-containing protein [Alkaliphilus metalliredigens]